METIDQVHGNTSDVEYKNYLSRVSARFALNTRTSAVFTTSAAADGLWDAYLNAFADPVERQHHNCNTCRSFIKRYGGLVVIDEAGNAKPAVWDVDDAYGGYGPAVEAMIKIVMAAKVTGVFLSALPSLGTPMTGDWVHLSVVNQKRFHNLNPRVTAGTVMAEKREQFVRMRRKLSETSGSDLVQAHALLAGGHLHRGDKFVAQAEWLKDLHSKVRGAAGRRSDNILWLAIARDTGFARGSMVDTLVDDLVAGHDIASIKSRWAVKMATYQRAQAAPSTGQISAAERAVEEMGVAPAFDRRYATKADIDVPGAILWQPSAAAAVHETEPARPSLFDHLKATAPAAPGVMIPPVTMTWEKFQRDVLPGAAEIHYRVPEVGRFCSLTAAVDASAPPILQWDGGSQRNTVSWAFPSPAARADQWNLKAGSLARVHTIVSQPNQWRGAEAFAHQGKGVFLLINGARDMRDAPGGGLFSEHLRSDLKPYRAVIEAHMNRMKVEVASETDTVGFGIGLPAGGDWTERAAQKIDTPVGGIGGAVAPKVVHAILVVDDSGSMVGKLRAARQCVERLMESIRQMPGQVDVTFTLFGTRSHLISDRVHIAGAGDFSCHMGARSGGTALNDAVSESIERALSWHDARSEDTSFFLGVITDGEEINSRRTAIATSYIVTDALATGRWTIAFAGVGGHARRYAKSIGIPDGNIKVFENSSEGFEEAGHAYASSTTALARSYAGGARASTSFFSAASTHQAIGADLPVLVVTHKSGGKSQYKLDRWE